MKRRLLIGLGVVVLILAGLAAPFIAAFAGNAPAVAGTELPGGARLVADGFAMLYLIPTGEKELALVDCGVDPEGKAVLSELQRRGLGPDAVTQIFLTHGHRDHVAACGKFPRAQVHALSAELPLLQGKPLHASPLSRFMHEAPVPLPIAPVEDGATVQAGEKQVQVFALPGHTDGSAAYLVDGVLYVGDSAGLSSSGALSPAPWIFSVDTAQNRAALVALARRLDGQKVQSIAFGHTAPGKAQVLFDYAP